jgi:electron transfer DM13
MMSNRLLVVLLVLIVAGAGAWYAFRPERLFINQKVNEQFPTASAAHTQVAAGQFHSGAHETKGMATVFQLADGKKTLRLTNFATSNGPDVHVYLVAAADARDNDTVSKAEYVDLGTLKGNIGDQNYELPANADLAKYRAVTIWCKRFSVNFGTAPLMNDAMQAMNMK